ncbi:MAG: hypothetical protein WAL15_03285 [Xanthobacteraceae bacterium]
MKMTVLGAAAVSMIGAVAVAQPAPSRPTPSQPAPAPAPVAPSSQDTAAASGNSNQTVATTNANAPTPARGANNFTEGEARSKIESNGYSNVSGLTKDDNGVWRGNAQKGSQQAQVWLDYKGNVGQQ